MKLSYYIKSLGEHELADSKAFIIAEVEKLERLADKKNFSLRKIKKSAKPKATRRTTGHSFVEPYNGDEPPWE